MTVENSSTDILIVGGGGREHALGFALRQSRRAGRLYFAPGNAGTAHLADSVNIGLAVDDVVGLSAFCEQARPGLVVIGPEAPLALGLADRLREMGLKVFGPGQAAARLESSKVWAKGFMRKYHIPAAHEAIFEEVSPTLAYLDRQAGPYVVKADGLAAGKGVLVTNDRQEAKTFAEEVLRGQLFGTAGSRLLVEEYLEGLEVSVLALCDTLSGAIVALEPACDYKRAYDGDNGPNTGGLGAYSPPAQMDAAMRERVQREILEPTLAGLRQEGLDYRGIVYAGLMLTNDGPKVLEYNCRFGDPETQVVLPRLKSDLLDGLEAVAEGRLAALEPLEWDSRASVGVVLSAAGYPGPYAMGQPITGLANFAENNSRDMYLFQAGTALSPQGTVVTSGGRVLNLVALDHSLAAARARVYNILAENKPYFEGMHFRRDIAAREVGKQA